MEGKTDGYYYTIGLNPIDGPDTSAGIKQAGKQSCDKYAGVNDNSTKTGFDGWYLDAEHLNKIEKIPVT